MSQKDAFFEKTIAALLSSEQENNIEKLESLWVKYKQAEFNDEFDASVYIKRLNEMRKESAKMNDNNIINNNNLLPSKRKLEEETDIEIMEGNVINNNNKIQKNEE